MLLLVALLGGCGKDPLYSKLDEQQANEMLAVLVGAGIDASKTAVEDGWSIEVSSQWRAQCNASAQGRGLSA